MYPYYTNYQELRSAIVARATGLGEFSHNVTSAELNLGPVLARARGLGNISFLQDPLTGMVGMGITGGPEPVITPDPIL